MTENSAIKKKIHVHYFQVMWLDHRTKTLTLEARRIIADERITIERPDIGDWNLYIHGVELSDAGKYMCQVNTVPVKIKYVILTVHGRQTQDYTIN